MRPSITGLVQTTSTAVRQDWTDTRAMMMVYRYRRHHWEGYRGRTVSMSDGCCGQTSIRAVLQRHTRDWLSNWGGHPYGSELPTLISIPVGRKTLWEVSIYILSWRRWDDKKEDGLTTLYEREFQEILSSLRGYRSVSAGWYICQRVSLSGQSNFW